MDPVTEAGEVLRGRATQARERLDEAMQTSRERLETNVQDHPLRTIAVSVGAGVLLGLLLGLAKRRRSD